jgi:hypothetical protein
MTTSWTRLWLLWLMGPGVGRRLAEDDSSLFAEDIVRLADTEGIADVELVRLEKASDLHSLWYDWMLVIDLDDSDAQWHVAVFFDELRSVGARPIMLRQADQSAFFGRRSVRV